MPSLSTSRRSFLAGSGGALLTLRYGSLGATGHAGGAYRRWEDIMRNKWTWDRVVRGSHGTNCTGNCAFNVYVRNGIVWREEQQAEYAPSTPDTPDYGPRGCQKGLRHAKYMYGNQRILYPLKRVGERGAGQWERITWEQAASEIADRYIDHVVATGPRSVTFGLGTQMLLKRATFAAFARFQCITGAELPESFAGVGDLPTGIYMTVGEPLLGDTMASVFKSKCCLIWYCNPAVTRIPDAHFFWEARYNGTEVITIVPEFNPTALHSSKWVNPKPGTDAALAMSMVQVVLSEGLHDAAFIKEQSDLPFLVRIDNGKFLRGTDLGLTEDNADQLFYIHDKNTDAIQLAPGTGFTMPIPGAPPVPETRSLELGDLDPALDGKWTIDTPTGPVEVTTVFQALKTECDGLYTPETVSGITGVAHSVIRQVARTFAESEASMIFSGYRVCKWLHGDLMQRAFMLLLSVTGNLGRPGTGLQLWNMPRDEDIAAFAFEGIPPTLRVATMARWDYSQTNAIELNREIYGNELAEHHDKYNRIAQTEGNYPNYDDIDWKMGVFMGLNPANWRGSSERWRKDALEELETIVVAAPDMGTTPMYADYILPAAGHYERMDMLLEPRTPYVQAMDEAVPPLGEAKDDFAVLEALARAISERATERDVPPVQDNYQIPVSRDFKQFHTLYTKNGTVKSTEDILNFMIPLNEGLPQVPFEEMARHGIMKTNDAEDVIYGEHSAYHDTIIRSTRDKKPYKTLTGRQQFYIDHDWFLEEGEALPGYREPLEVAGYPLRMLMGHARHGIHSMWRDDPLLVSLQRGEPDIYVNPDDAASRGVEDGDLLRAFNSFGSFIAMAHVTSAMQPGMTFMYHGWDPMMFRGRKNFGAVIPTSGLIKPTSVAFGYGHIAYRSLAFEPNLTIADFTMDFEKYIS